MLLLIEQLRSVLGELVGQLDMGRMLYTVIRCGMEMLQMDSGAVVLQDEDRGTFVLRGYETAGQFIGSSISFPLQLETVPIGVIEVPWAASPKPAHCSGTPQTPTADPGWVCIYDRFSNNVSLSNGLNMQAADVDGTGGAANTFGLRIVTRPQATGGVDVEGSWAVTAP